MTLRIEDQAFRTDTGRQRNANEDSLFTRPPVFVVADGMGGAQAGEVASKTAAESFDRELPQAPPEQVLREMIEAANRSIHEHARNDPGLAGMGTTITAAIVDPESEEVAIGHVGDSRAYRLRGGKLERLTRDHSLVEEMRRKGQLTDAQAEDHPQRSIITRALGPEPEVEVDVQTVPAQAGDVFLICSDGLTTMLGDEQIARLLRRATSLEAAVRALVDEANRAGGRDNITVVAFRLEDAAAPQRAPEGATLVGPSAEAAGLTPSRAPAGCAPRRSCWPCSSSSARSPTAPGTATARSGSSAPTPPAALPSTVACRTNCPSAPSSTTSATRARSKPVRCRRSAATRSPGTACARAPTPFPCSKKSSVAADTRPRRTRERGREAPGDDERVHVGAEHAGGLMTSARNRELTALVPVAVLLTAGFAAVFAQENARLGNLSLVYGAYFLAVCLATLARDQANWFVLGLVLFALTIQFLRDYEVLERYRYTIAVAGLLLLLAPRLPGIGQQVNGAYLGIKIGPLAFQPAEFSKICIVVFLASYLREHREVLIVGARRVLGVTLPPLKHFGPMLVVWGASMFMLVFIRDLGSSLMFFAAFLALLYVATGRFSFVTTGMAMFVVGAWFFATDRQRLPDPPVDLRPGRRRSVR